MKKAIINYVKQYFKYYFLIIVVAIIISSGLLIGIPAGHDLAPHMARVVGMSQEIAEGQIPPLVVSNYANGFGYAWNLFYPPMAPYIAFIIQCLGFTYLHAFQIVIILSIITSGIAMFKLLEEITGNKNVGLLAAMIYMCAPYFLADIYTRMALGEILAYAFLPILFIGIYNLFEKTGNKHFCITIGAVGILLSHNISALFAVLLSVIYVIFNITKFNKFIFKKIWINVGFIILITLFFYAPLLQAQSSTNYQAFEEGHMGSTESLKGHTVYFYQLLFGEIKDGISAMSTDPNVNLEEDMSFQIGLFIIVPIMFTPFIFKTISKKNRKNYLLATILGILLIIPTTTIFPYEKMPETIAIIQFPWRLLFPVTFLWTIIAAINIYKACKTIDIKEIMVMTTLILIYVYPLICSNPVSYVTVEEFQEIDHIREEAKSSVACSGLEYLPHKAFENIDYVRNRSQEAICIEGDIHIAEQNKNGSTMMIKYQKLSEKATVELPYMYYPGYEIKVNDEKIEYTESENGFVQIEISGQETGTINVKYTGTLLARSSFATSLIAFIVFIIYIMIYMFMTKKNVEKQNQKLIEEKR